MGPGHRVIKAQRRCWAPGDTLKGAGNCLWGQKRAWQWVGSGAGSISPQA